MMLTLLKATLPPGERKLIELVQAALQSDVVSKVAPTISVSSLISQLRGDVPPGDMLDTIGRAIRQFSQKPSLYSAALEYFLSLAEKSGVSKEDVLGLATRLAKDLSLTLPQEGSASTKIGSVLAQVADNLKDPLAPVLGGVCACPRCDFIFQI